MPTRSWRCSDPPGWRPDAIELDDGREGGYRWRDLAEIAGRQRGRPVRTIALPWALLWPAAAGLALGGAALRRAPRLSPGKLRELFHADWVARPPTGPALQGWAPRTTFEEGFALTMAWYRHSSDGSEAAWVQERSDRDAMTDEANALFRDLCTILERYAPEGVELTPSTELSGDLNINSVAAMDMIMEIEDKFGIDIPMNLVSDLRNLQDLVDVVKQQIEGR